MPDHPGAKAPRVRGLRTRGGAGINETDLANSTGSRLYPISRSDWLASIVVKQLQYPKDSPVLSAPPRRSQRVSVLLGPSAAIGQFATRHGFPPRRMGSTRGAKEGEGEAPAEPLSCYRGSA